MNVICTLLTPPRDPGWAEQLASIQRPPWLRAIFIRACPGSAPQPRTEGNHPDFCSSLLQKEEERLRASIRRESQQRRMREKQHQRGLSASYLEPDRYDEEEEGEEAISLAAIKNRYKGGIRGSLPLPLLLSRSTLSLPVHKALWLVQ